MLTATSHETNSAKTNSSPKPSKEVEDSAHTQIDNNPLWSSLATRCGSRNPRGSSVVRRLCAECEKEQHAPSIQTKLAIGAPDDQYEREADAMAERVMRMPAPEREEGLGIQITANPAAIQRMCKGSKEAFRGQSMEEDEVTLQPKGKPGDSSGRTPLSAATADKIQSLRGGGRPLSKPEQSFFEPRFGADFSGVRVHDDARAADLARSVNARAFTLGNDVVFGRGEYSSDSVAGKSLLAHELTHVVQQNGSVPAVQRKRLKSPYRAQIVSVKEKDGDVQTCQDVNANGCRTNVLIPGMEVTITDEFVGGDWLFAQNLPEVAVKSLGGQKWIYVNAKYVERLSEAKARPTSEPKEKSETKTDADAVNNKADDLSSEVEDLLKEVEKFQKELETAEGRLAMARNVENLTTPLAPGLDPRKSPLAFYSHVSLPFNLTLFVALDIVAGLTQGVGTIQGGFEAVTGKSISGQIFKSLEHPTRELSNLPKDLEPWERVLSGAVALIGPARAIFKLVKGAKAARAAAIIVKISRQTGKPAKQVVKILQKLAQLHGDLTRLRKTLKSLRKVRALRWVYQNLDVGDKVLKNLSTWDARRLISFFKGAGTKALDKFRALSKELKAVLLGCSSPCKVDLNKLGKAIDANLAKAAAKQVDDFLKRYPNLLKKLKNQDLIKKSLGRLLMIGVVPPGLLAKMIDSMRGKGVARMLGLMEKAAHIKGAVEVFKDIAKGKNWIKGAEWVLRWIDAKGLWKDVKAFEKVGKNRFWDAHIGQKLYQFKSWLKFQPGTFVKQFAKDIHLKGAKLVVWVFEQSDEISDVVSVKEKMRAAIRASSLKAPEKTKLLAAVDQVVVHVDKITKKGP